MTGPPPEGRVRIAVDEPHRVRLRVESDRPAWLLLTDTWSRGWKATLDGEPVPVRIGLLAFRAVRVPEGDSVVEFRYEPEWLGVVPLTAGAGLLLLAAAFGWGWWRKRKKY
jgi:uncharacterized membrane protein YfhO